MGNARSDRWAAAVILAGAYVAAAPGCRSGSVEKRVAAAGGHIEAGNLQMQEIGPPDAYWVDVKDVNNAGTIAGTVYKHTDDGDVSHVFRQAAGGELEELPVPGPNLAVAMDINE